MCIVRACWWVSKTSSPWWDGIHSVKCQCIWCFHGFIHYCGSDACSVHVGMKRLEFPACEEEKVALLQAANTSACWFSRFCAWHGPGLAGSRPQLHVSSVLVFFPSLCMCKNTDRLSHHQRDHSEGTPRKQKIKIDLSVPAQIVHSWDVKDVVSLSSQAFFSFFFLVLWLKWLEEC